MKAEGQAHGNEQQASRDRRVAFGLSQRSGDQRRSGADLPDHQLPVPRHAARGQPVRPGRDRQHLHPHHEPDQRRAGDSASPRSRAASPRWRWARARRRRCSPSRTSATPATTSSPRPTSMAAPGTCSPTRMKSMGIECRFVDPADPENFRRATDAKTRCYYAETLPNPKLDRVPDRRGGEDRPRARRAADHGQHGGAGALPAARPWRGDRDALDHQVYRRPRHLDRRHPGRWRQLRLGEAQRPLPDAEHARPELPRRGVDAGGQADGADRLHHQGTGDPAARHRRADEPVQRLHVHPGAGDPAAAHARALRQRQRRGQASRQAPQDHQGDPSHA